MGGGPVGVFVRGDEGVGAHLQRVGFLGRGAGDGDDGFGVERFGPEEAEVAEAADADDSDAFGRAGAVLAEWGVGGYAAAEHGGGFFRGDGGRDRDHEVAVSAPVFGVSAVGFGVVGPFGIVGVDAVVLAVLFKVGLAFVTVRAEAGAGLCADTDAVANFDAGGYVLADADGFADDLVAYYDRVVGWSPAGAESVQIRATDAAVGDLDVNVVLFKGLGLVALVDHFPVGGFWAETHPAFELVLVLCHDVFLLRELLRLCRYELVCGRSSELKLLQDSRNS